MLLPPKLLHLSQQIRSKHKALRHLRPTALSLHTRDERQPTEKMVCGRLGSREAQPPGYEPLYPRVDRQPRLYLHVRLRVGGLLRKNFDELPNRIRGPRMVQKPAVSPVGRPSKSPRAPSAPVALQLSCPFS